MNKDKEQEFLAFDVVDSVGEFIEYWGFKKIHGRVWAMIYLSDKPISTPDLVSKLGVSKGLVSIAINELLDYQLIHKASKVIYGGQTYTAEEDIGSVIRKVLRDRELGLLTKVEVALEKLASYSEPELERSNISKSRLKELTHLTTTHKTLLKAMVKRNFSTIAEWKDFLKSAIAFLKLNKGTKL